MHVGSDISFWETLLRVLTGLLFVGHGSHKLFRAEAKNGGHPLWGGPGLEEYSQIFGDMGLRPARPMALMAGIGQLVCGFCLAAGFLTAFSCFVLLVTLLVGIVVVLLPNGAWVLNGGWEYAVVLSVICLIFTERGPGKYSLDSLMSIDYHGIYISFAAIIVSVLFAALIYLFLGKPQVR